VLKIEVILGIIASSVAIIAFMARAYANIRRGRRVKRYTTEAARRADDELRRIQEESEAAREIMERKRDRERASE
jgi:hypothetical protein